MELKDKHILVTGADGFIGSHLVELLLSKGYRVRALAQYNSFNHLGWLEEVSGHKLLELVSGDVRDPHFCHRLTEDVDLIFHLAALIAIPYSYMAPDSYVDTNIRGTLNICRAALDNRCKRIIHTSTSEVYGTAQYVPIDEKHPLQPQSPYSASKIGADAIAMSFFNSFELPLVVARPFNTYGPRQSARAVIPTVISQIAAGAREIRVGDLRPTRDFTYVTDTCEGFILLAGEDKALGQTVNIGSGFEISIGALIEEIKTMMNSDAQVIEDNQRLRPDKSEVFRLFCDNTNLKSMCGYQPKLTLKEGLQRTVDWFSRAENLRRYKTETYNV